ncbi:MAG: alpha/beta hydrolase [Bacteroidales bacterium]|nr:alpha/beta hydrolase [Bacteroidales bacterium]
MSANAQENVKQLQPISAKRPHVVQPNWKLVKVNTANIKTKYIGVPYSNVSKTQTLDIYLPNKGKGPFPVILAVHGGAFVWGNSFLRDDVGPQLEGVNRGYAVVSVNYRLSGEAPFPRAVNDVKAAVRFIKANAKKYNLNPNKIAAWGCSAGGNLVSMLGTTANVNNLNGDDTSNLKYSSRVQAVVDWYGPTDFLKFNKYFKEYGVKPLFGSNQTDNSFESWYIGQNIAKDPSFTEKANPETYIQTMNPKTAPYFFIEHGTKDQNVPTLESVHFAHQLEAKIGKNKVTLVLLKGEVHGGPKFRTPQNLNMVYQFLDKVLKNKE